MNLVETTAEAKELIDKVRSYGESVNSQIADMQKTINEAEQKYIGNTQKFIDRQKRMLREKITRYMEYMNQQLANAQADAQGQIDKITQDIENQLLSQAKKHAEQLKKFAE